MRLSTSEPDIETLVGRIKREDIDLQPDFQRGEVWSDAKKRRLIDSILRDWHMPPIHIIEIKENAKQVVLDGQQRLVSIREFAENRLRVDGHVPPIDANIQALDGFTFDQLPDDYRRRFNRYNVRVILITDYKPEEPGELFFRLNQPTFLTSAEQRNAFFGPAREQIKVLVDEMEKNGLNKDFTGFSNSRMAYDDIVARLCFSLEVGTLTEKITTNGLSDRYRSSQPFPDHVIWKTEESVKILGSSRLYVQYNTRFNKATLYSWLKLMCKYIIAK